MTRPNRAQRRARQDRTHDMLWGAQRRVAAAILPGLPGSLRPYVSRAEQEAFMEEHLDALAAMHPGMVWRAVNCERLGIPSVPPVRLRYVREAAPDGLGAGVVLGEFTAEAPARQSKLILPGKDRDEVRRRIVWPGQP